MKNIFNVDEWKIIEEGFDNQTNEISESVMSLANGHMGLRGNFEEEFSGKTLKGTYAAGVYFPDKTRVGWWKNGYPEYFAKVLNSCDFISLNLAIDGETVDVNKSETKNFIRTLDMKQGIFLREFDLILKSRKKVHISTMRFVSMANKEVGAIKYSIKPYNCDVDVCLTSYLNGEVKNIDANYDEVFWEKEFKSCDERNANITLNTKKTNFIVSTTKTDELYLGSEVITKSKIISDDYLFAGNEYNLKASEEKELCLYKYFSVTTSRDYEKNDVREKSIQRAVFAKQTGFKDLLKEHKEVWSKIWSYSDIEIKGDEKSQQAIRFNIFHLNQTYTGDDSRLNIGPKGFTGEKYGGGTYWDTESFCLPFFLSTTKEEVSKNLLIYRYNHLEKAKDNAEKLGCMGALYPMVTMNGEESHNEWEITFEEIHRNAAITYAIKNYVDYTGDDNYLAKYGIYVLYETARFWSSRVNYNSKKKKYMILGVTGPNEYENNVNNNWYTNKMAAFSLRYTYEVVTSLKIANSKNYREAEKQLNINDEELEKFINISDNMYFPHIDEYNIFSQQDGYMDKEQMTADNILESDRPIYQNWSWDRILRSCFIKQADVLQGIYNFRYEFDDETKRRNFDFYEPKTVHESSLSSCIHSIIASDIGYLDKAYQLFLRASRLDLDNYNKDTCEGLHITSTAGSWLTIVHGFGGLRIKDGKLILEPSLPKAWTEYSFNIYFRGSRIHVIIDEVRVLIKHKDGQDVSIILYDKFYVLKHDQRLNIKR
jgi:maltose phosphorylase